MSTSAERFSVTPSFEPLSPEDIYHALEAGSIELRTAIRLIRDALGWLDFALKSFETGELIHADDAMQHVQAVLPELFCCRRLGDGFGAVVNAIQSSFENQSGKPLSDKQARSVRAALQKLLDEPSMTFDQASELIDRLESDGLLVDPGFMAPISELLVD